MTPHTDAQADTETGLAQGTRSILRAPRTSLCSCIRAYISRDTTNAPSMAPGQRRNHFPASSYCVVTWYLQGQAIQVQQGERQVEIPYPRPIAFGGVRTEPTASYNPGPVKTFMLVLLPESLHAMTGLAMAAHTDRGVAFDEVFDPAWQAMAQAVLAAADDDARIAVIEAFLEPRWQAARSRAGMPVTWLHDYLQGLAVRMIASEWSRSLRQMERRVKTWAGVPLQRLRSMRRNEQRFLSTFATYRRNGDISWADEAIDTGFADQAHLCRETRKASGLSPKELQQRILHEESYWPYRIWS